MTKISNKTNIWFRTLCVVTEPGEVIKQADIKCIPSEGMPTHRKESFPVF